MKKTTAVVICAAVLAWSAAAETVSNYDRYKDVTWVDSASAAPLQYTGADGNTADSSTDTFSLYYGDFGGGTRILRARGKVLAPAYVRLKTVLFINKDNMRLSCDIPYEDAFYDNSFASFDIHLVDAYGVEQIPVESLQTLFRSEGVELVLNLNETPFYYILSKEKCAELLEVLDAFTTPPADTPAQEASGRQTDSSQDAALSGSESAAASAFVYCITGRSQGTVCYGPAASFDIKDNSEEVHLFAARGKAVDFLASGFAGADTAAIDKQLTVMEKNKGVRYHFTSIDGKTLQFYQEMKGEGDR